MSALQSLRQLWWLAALAIPGGCADLPPLPARMCGNGAIELGEDCDTFSPYPGLSCRARDKPQPCHLDCSPNGAGERPDCPPGWGCDATSVCRPPSGRFLLPAKPYAVGPVSALLAGDFDGDGRHDLVSRRPTDRLDRSQLALHFFDERGALVETRSFPKSVSLPWFGVLSKGDQRADLVFNDFRIGVLLGRTDRRLVPETFSSYRVPDTLLRVVGVSDTLVNNTLSLVVFANYGGRAGFRVPDQVDGASSLRSMGNLPTPIDARTEPVAGDLIEGAGSPCDEVVLAAPGASTFRILDLCRPPDENGKLSWRESAEQREVSLAPAARLDGPVRIADLDGDQHLDLLLSAEGRAYVAYGNGKELAPAIPFVLSYLDNRAQRTDDRLPLAVGDFTGDGWVDFVYPEIFISSFSRAAGEPPHYEAAVGNLGVAWTEARIADVTGNGKNDVIAASNEVPGIAVYSGNDTPYLWPFSVPTEQPVLFLNIADLDIDLTNDVAFVEAPAPGEERAALSIAFGNVGRPPSNPVPVARVLAPQQLAAYRVAARGNLALATAFDEPYTAGGLTVLDGTTDRVPYAPYALASFSDDQDLADFPALQAVGGSFRGRDHHDVIAFGNHTTYDDAEPKRAYKFWFLADVAEGRSTPARLVGGDLDPSFKPADGMVGQELQHLASAAADLDGDQLDEALWAMPDQTGGCALLRFGVEFDGAPKAAPKLVRSATLRFDAPCDNPQVAGFDADMDGDNDLLLLTGGATDEDRKLLALWNDGHGEFAVERATQLNDDADSPHGFATLPATTARGTSVVYATRTHAVRRSWSEREGTFAPAEELTTLSLGGGVASGDLNGDGAYDLAFADGNQISVLLAELASR